MTDENEILCVNLVLPCNFVLYSVNVYCPSGFKSFAAFDQLLSRHAGKYIFPGDSNSSSTAWGSRSDLCGVQLWSGICDNNCTLGNSDVINVFRGLSKSAIDLTFFLPQFTCPYGM